MPTDVFKIVERKSNEKGFYEKRKKAEVLARTKSNNKEITLDDIYACYDGDRIDVLMVNEINTEIELSFINKEIQRIYFSEFNAKKCDAIRTAIEEKHTTNLINDNEYFFLLGSLINSIDKYANTASVYGAFLKNLKKSAQKEMVLEPLPIIQGQGNYQVYNEDINELIKKISGDILYLDPPYNARQYCTNYHMLETIARNDNPVIHGKTGLREYSEQKSLFCTSSQVESVFADLIRNAKFKYIFLSYNNEGLMSFDTIEKIMKKYGKYKVYMKEYHRFKADNARESKADNTIEYLHCLIKK